MRICCTQAVDMCSLVTQVLLTPGASCRAVAGDAKVSSSSTTFTFRPASSSATLEPPSTSAAPAAGKARPGNACICIWSMCTTQYLPRESLKAKSAACSALRPPLSGPASSYAAISRLSGSPAVPWFSPGPSCHS